MKGVSWGRGCCYPSETEVQAAFAERDELGRDVGAVRHAGADSDVPRQGE